MEQFIIQFENITKFPLLSVLERMAKFLEESFDEIESYFSGTKDSVDSYHLNELLELNNSFLNLDATFNKFSNKLSNSGFWELLDYVSDLRNVLEKINKMPKFKRTAFNYSNYISKIQSSGIIGGQKTFENLSSELNLSTENWINLMIENNINENEWDIDTLKNVKLFTPNELITVQSILDQPIGERVYGKDFNKKIDFENNDIELVEYSDNILQKCEILSNLTKGDIPEFLQFGRTQFQSNYNQFIYPKLVNELKDIFFQNDLFESVELKDFKYESSDVIIELYIKTKYDYKTEINIKV